VSSLRLVCVVPVPHKLAILASGSGFAGMASLEGPIGLLQQVDFEDNHLHRSHHQLLVHLSATASHRSSHRTDTSTQLGDRLLIHSKVIRRYHGRPVGIQSILQTQPAQQHRSLPWLDLLGSTLYNRNANYMRHSCICREKVPCLNWRCV
jgi:hypothetical protein